MYRTCIAVVDASRARLFTYERSSEPEGLKETLTEDRDLVDPARDLRGGSHDRHADRQDAHVRELDTAFSRSIIAELVALMRSVRAQRVILCASPHMLGELRAAGGALPREGVQVDELARDFTKLTPVQLREHLASHGLLPAPQPHGQG